MNTFPKYYPMGKAGESLIATWLRRRGNGFLPIYEKIIDEGKGPQLYLPDGELIAPDLLVFGGKDRIAWIEAKHKTAFTFHRKSGLWVTGIDLRHYSDYLMVDEKSPWPVWLLFLQGAGRAKDSPEGGPTGLYGEALAVLKTKENHRHMNWGKSGMVYWAEKDLRWLAPLSELGS